VNREVFVYQRNNEIKASYYEEAIHLEDDPEWEHIGTLEPAAYIQWLLREYPALVRKLKGE